MKKEEFDRRLWEQLELQIVEIINILMETKDEEICKNKRTLINLNDRIHQLPGKNKDLQREINSIKNKKEQTHSSNNRGYPRGAKSARRGGYHRKFTCT
jgi:hypothetical protein